MTSATISAKTNEMQPDNAALASGKAKGAAPGAKKPGITFFNGPKKVKEFTKKEQVDMFRGIG